ncbi:MAG: hypothetical protein K8S99_02835 [Planctomycetes bacterium]|nr:hypothetical protein [Planctomycetota bacterium]
MSRHDPVIFDDGAGHWGPMTDLRAVFELRTGAVTTLARIERVLGARSAALRVPDALAALVAERHAGRAVNVAPSKEPTLFVNGRWLAVDHADAVRGLEPGEALTDEKGDVVAAHVEPRLITFNNHVPTLDPVVRVRRLAGRVLIDRPWHILESLERVLLADLEATDVPVWRDIPTVSCVGEHAIRVEPDARVHTMVVLNAEKGPIVIDRHAVIGSFVVIAGPCYIGPHTIIGPASHIRANTVIGDHCVAAGEISHCVFQGFSNKAHTGYLGNSYVGEWVNLGADTNASNLKNTYGPVRMQITADTVAEDSGQMKLGPLIGDFTRTAIGSRLMTGSCLSTGTMLAVSGFCPKFTRRFAFLTDEGEEAYHIDKFLDAARKAMARRKCELTPVIEARLRTLAR